MTTANAQHRPSKVFNDPIHGHIELHPLLIKIIDTPQFQRLRNIKQLGGTYLVYPGASHNRFEHSLGVAHLAGQLLKTLRERQPELGITDEDILCVQIAGLCHDLGHGPFSHLFDGKFLPRARDGDYPKHEELSVKMFDYLLEKNNLMDEMKKYKVAARNDIKFIKEMILRPDTTENEWTLEGRPKEKAFLYDIVNNKDTGVDVDKFDYLARDCYYLGIPNNFDYHRFLHFARVCEVDGKKIICTRDKMYNNMYNLFYTRLCLHQKACYHQVSDLIQEMITEILLEADGKSLNRGTEDPKVCLSEAVRDMEKYSKLTDQVLDQILNSTSDELKEARRMLNELQRRELYKMVGEKPLEDIPEANNHLKKVLETPPQSQFLRNLIECLKEKSRSKQQPLSEAEFLKMAIECFKEALKESFPDNDFIVTIVEFNYGKRDKNPLDNFYFYSKENPDEARRLSEEEVPIILPKLYSKKVIRLYSKIKDKKTIEKTKTLFDVWYIFLLRQGCKCLRMLTFSSHWARGGGSTCTCQCIRKRTHCHAMLQDDNSSESEGEGSSSGPRPKRRRT